jgi:acetyl esterase
MPFAISPSVFDPAAIAPETAALNDDIVARQALMPDVWAFPAAQVRELRKSGRGIIPVAPESRRATTIEIPGLRGNIPLRVIPPAGGASRGAFLHIHYGGWTFGGADLQDDRLEAIADATGLAAVSVEYKLAPEWPYPAAHDDCEHAALWLIRNAPARHGGPLVAIGGESAGAHLSVCTMLRLRDRHGLTPFRAANLVAGCYDLALTPSAAGASVKLILNTRDIRNFVANLVPAGVSLDLPDLSPLKAELRGLPPCHLSVGTRDPLLDDSLFMAARLAAANVAVDLAVWPGGCHVFQAFADLPLTKQADAASLAFLKARLG